MSQRIDRDTIIAFLFDALPQEQMSLVSDAILADENLMRIYAEEKIKIDVHLYVDNELSPSQRLEFQQKLKKSVKLLKEVHLQQEVNTSLENLALKESLEEAYRNYESSMKHIPTHSISRRSKNWLIAASIAVLLMFGAGVAYLFQPSDSLENRLYTKYYTPLNYQDIYALNNNYLDIAKQKYMDGEYMNALLLLKNLPSSVTIEVERNMFIGLSLMEVGKYEMAAGYFEGILASQGEFDFIPQVRWYLGLCYLKLGSKEKATVTFRAIANSNDYSYKKAKRILERLRD